MITADLIMSAPGGRPCSDWPHEKVERVLTHLDCSSWVALAESARAKKWRLVSLAELRLTAYRVATREQRIAGVRRSTFIRIDAQVKRWPDAPDEVQAVRGELLRWCAGEDLTLDELRALGDEAWSAAAAADADAYAAAAADADADAAAADADAYAEAEALNGLRYICGLLDGTVTP